MQTGQSSERYAATVATEILREDSYHFVKTELAALGLWDADFQQLETTKKTVRAEKLIHQQRNARTKNATHHRWGGPGSPPRF